MAARKTEAEWDRIELEYLQGEISVREIADRFDISDTAIRKRAKRDGWVRAVRKPKSANLGAETVPALRRESSEPVEAAVIAERGRQLVARMLDELDATTTLQGELESLIEDECANDRDDRRRDGMLGAVSLPSRAKTLKELATALKTVNEAGAPGGKKAAAQERADKVGERFKPIGPPRLTAVK